MNPPPATPESGRSAFAAPRSTLFWLYLLVVLPVLTDIVETGGLPRAPREWLTEVAAGAVIAGLVWKVRKEHLALQVLARVDGLTGLWNRRNFEETLADECSRARRSHQPLSLVCIDLDHFKQVNDRDGHAQGDRILQQLAAAIGQAVRSGIDRGFRIGGDEFALLLPGSTGEQAAEVVNRIRELCKRCDPVWVGGPLGISAGVVEFDPGETVAALARRADVAMYREKASRHG
jgi:diguanylate cyclase (GGDEF)-like protein